MVLRIEPGQSYTRHAPVTYNQYLWLWGKKNDWTQSFCKLHYILAMMVYKTIITKIFVNLQKLKHWGSRAIVQMRECLNCSWLTQVCFPVSLAFHRARSNSVSVSGFSLKSKKKEKHPIPHTHMQKITAFLHADNVIEERNFKV